MPVSVIMPYYKKRDFIHESIESILKQTYKDFEIIIIYDDENIHDYSFVKDFEKKDKRIKVIKNLKNIGAGLSRNVGIDKSNNEFIAFLDCDDVWKQDKLEFQLNFMKEKNIDISFTAYDIVDKNRNIIKTREAKNCLEFKDLIRSCDIGLSTVVIKKSLLNKKYRFPSIVTKEDYVLWLELSKRNVKFYGINKSLTQWKKLNNSLSSNFIQKVKDGFVVYNKYMKYDIFTSTYYLLRLSFNFLLKM